jgi:hypothetical protein
LRFQIHSIKYAVMAVSPGRAFATAHPPQSHITQPLR